MKHTAEGLAAYVSDCLKKNTKYMFGALMEPITEELIERVTSRYPNQYPPERVEELRACIGTDCYGTDCSGLIKSYYWGGIGSEEYDEGTDWNSGKLLLCSAESNDITTLPEIPGLCLYMKGHVGVYLGNGKVIQSTHSEKFGDGVVMADLKQQAWTKWFMCPLVAYPELPKTALKQLKVKEITKGNSFIQKLERLFWAAKIVSGKTGRMLLTEMAGFMKERNNNLSLETNMVRRMSETTKQQENVLTESGYIDLAWQMNKRWYKGILRDKIGLLARLGNLIQRDYLDFTEATKEQIEEFCKRNPAIVVKDMHLSGGAGIRVYRKLPKGEEWERLVDEWKGYSQAERINHHLLAEKMLYPHPQLAAVFPGALCSVRIHTALCGDEVKIVLCSSVRFGRKGSDINLCDKGYTVYLDEYGKSMGGAMNEFSMRLQQRHADTKAEFATVEIPYWEECIKLVKAAAKRVPEVPFIGWDVAVTEQGPEIIEGTFISGNVMKQQLYLAMTGKCMGLLQQMEEIRDFVLKYDEEK